MKVERLEDAQQAQREIFNQSYKDGPFRGVLAELSNEKRIEFSLKFIPDGALVLDFGCGDGTISKGILAKARKVVSIDVSEQAIAVAKQFNSHPDIQYLNTTIEDYTPDEKFDAVVMFEVIEHVFNPEAVLEKVTSLLKEEGVLIISTPNFMRLTRRVKGFYGIREIRKMMGKDPDRIGCDHFQEYTYEALKEMFEKAGFEVLKREGIVFWSNTIGGDLCRSIRCVQWANFYFGALFPSIAGHIYLAAKKRRAL